MEKGLEEQEASPKPLAFTIDFGGGNAARYRDLSERYKKRHRRGQSLGGQPTEKTLSPEGSHSPSEDSSVSQARRRSELTLPVKGVLADSTTSLKETPTPSPEMKPKMDVKPSLNRRSSLDVRPNPNTQPSPHAQPNPKPNNSAQPSPLPSPSGGGEGTESDAVSDAGTYTLDAENYSEEQKARMSIDAKFRMEKEISMRQKTEQYVQSLLSPEAATEPWRDKSSPIPGPAPSSSPILSPTQHTMSITHTTADDEEDKVFTKIMFPSPKARSGLGLSQFKDEGSVISVTSSGAFRPRPPPPPPPAPVWATGRRHPANLSKSEVQVETYVDESSDSRKEVIHASITLNRSSVPRLTTNIINVQSISLKEGAGGLEEQLLGKSKAKSSPSSSPTHVSRTRGGDDNTEAYLQPAVHIINSLQKRLSLDPQGAPPLNNTRLPLHHARHNSLDNNDRLPNKLEHFYAKNLQAGIDQTPPSPRLLNQYRQATAPSTGSPIKRSSSFGIKNTNLVAAGQLKESNVRPVVSSVQRSASTAMVRPHMQVRYRGTLTSQGVDRNRYGDTEEDEEDSTTSTEEDEGEQQQQQRRKADPLITNTRYNRAFSLRRARLEVTPTPQPKCPNTPEMRRKFPISVTERAASVDRKPSVNNTVPSRYLQGVQGKRAATEPPVGHKSGKGTNAVAPANTVRPSPVLSRSDANRFSVRNSGGSKLPAGSSNSQRANRKDSSKTNSGGTGKGKSGGPRSNSSLSSREVEFQNWKRRKSYDPMKAAAEGKRKELMARRQQQQPSPAMTQSYTGGPPQDCDSSSPSHSGSVHRSQSFHGTGASLGGPPLSSEDDDDDLTLSADEGGFSPPTPSPCELSPARTACLRTTALRERSLYSQL